MKSFYYVLTIVMMGLFIGCENPDVDSGEYSVNGSVQKGPFIQGSSITIQALDDNLEPIGKNYQTQTTDDKGSFSVGKQINNQFVEIIANGYYFNEITGKVSTAPITLRSYSDLSEGGTVNVNILTTLEMARIKYLVTEKQMSLVEARLQAEKEILSIFNIPTTMLGVSFDKMDISQAGDANAVLLAISIMMQYGRSEGEMLEFITKVAADVANDGVLDNEDYKESIRYGAQVWPKLVRDNLYNRYKGLGVENPIIPSFEDFMDGNANGVIDRDEDWFEVEQHSMFSSIPAEGGTIDFIVRSNVDYDIQISEDAQDWLTLDTSRASIKTETVTFVAAKNETYTKREGSITFSANGVSRNFSFTQLQDETFVYNGEYEYNIPIEGGRITIEFESNIETQLQIPLDAQYWISIVPPSKDTDKKIVLDIAHNNGALDTRTAVLELHRYPYYNKIVEFTINQECEKGLYLSTEGVNIVDTEGGEFTISYGTNMECEVIIPDDATDWLSISDGTKATFQYENVYLSVNKNDTGKPRSANLIIQPVDESDYSYRKIVTVAQSSDGNIEFADINVKRVLVTKFDKNSDGELSYKEAISVTNLGSNLFGNVASGIQSFDEFQYFLGLSEIDWYAFQECVNLKTIIIPKGVTKIWTAAFANCLSITSIELPEGVTMIDRMAFYGCKSLTNIVLPECVETIGEDAFAYCAIESITIPESVTSLDGTVFYNCPNLAEFKGKFASADGHCLIVNNEIIDSATAGLTTYTIPEGVTTIGLGSFAFSHMENVIIPEGVYFIEDTAFGYSSHLTSITIPNSVSSIGDYVFKDCKSLKNITIPDGVVSLGDNVFENCTSLETVKMGKSITAIGAYLFFGCESLTNITLPEGITYIGQEAFRYCSKLTSIILPNSVRAIGSWGFLDCSSLKSVYCKPITPPTLGNMNYVFNNNASGRKIYVPASDDDSIINAYKAASGWSEYSDEFEEYEYE